MVEGELRHNGKIYFDTQHLSRSTKAVEVLTDVIKCYNEHSVQDISFNQRRNEAIDDLKEVCQSAYSDPANVYIFGSCINGFGTKSSDVDCFVMGNFDINKKNSYFNPLQRCCQHYSSPFKVISFVRRSKNPVLTLKHKKNGIELDVTFASASIPKNDVLENSSLLSAYAHKNMKIAAVGRFIKFVLSKEPHLGSAKIGGLSSYSHVIMFIYFLLHSQHKLGHVVVKCPYINREEEIEASEGELFLDFLRFYSCEFDSSKLVIDIRDFDVKKTSPKYDNKAIFTIEDPIITKNLGKTMSAKRAFELKIFYYYLLKELSDHSMNETELMDFIGEIGDLELSQQKMPRLHPLCEPDYEEPRPPREESRKGKRKNRKGKRAGQETKQDVAGLTQPTSSGKAKKKQTPKKEGANKASASPAKESFIVDISENSVIIDPYTLEDMMKEIETPEKSRSDKNPQKRSENRSDTAILTQAMLEESKKLDKQEGWTVANFASTDVMGDIRALIAVPLLATLGFKVPNVQVGNNTNLEKLKCIPGFSPELTLEQMNSMLENLGCFVGYSQDMNLVESKMMSVMKSVGTIQSEQLDLARYFSLVAACGVEYYFSDVKCSNKKKLESAVKQANDITDLTKKLNMKCRVQVSDATVPYSRMLGYPLEIRDVIDILSGEGSRDMVDIMGLQCGHILQMSGKADSLRDGEKMVVDVLASGQCLDKFLEMLQHQGVSRDITTKLREKKYDEVFQRDIQQTKIDSRITGLVTDIRLEVLERLVSNHLGGYGSNGQGLELCVDMGCKITEGAPLAILHHAETAVSNKMINMVNRAIEIEKTRYNRIMRTFRNDDKRHKKKKNSKSTSKDVPEKQDDKVTAEMKEGVVAEEKEGVSSSLSNDSVPKDYVVVVNSENGEEERTVLEKKE